MTSDASRSRRFRIAAVFALAAFLLGEPVRAGDVATEADPAPSRPELPQGIAIAEATADSALVWARCPDATSLRVSVDGAPERAAPTLASRDFTARIELSELRPGAEHAVRARCVRDDATSEIVAGRFRTAPAATEPSPVRFAFGGDVGGQNVCRDVERGYPIFAQVAAARPDFFIALGDLIYADDPCLEVGRLGNRQVAGPPRALARDGFREHWRYNRSERGQRELLSNVAYYAIWDDHEVLNDFGPREDAPRAHPDHSLMAAGLDAFLEYNPIRPAMPGGTRLYRSARWGRHVELFLLDARQHRDRNASPDDGAEPKTLLGKEQRDWLVRSMLASDATWKVVVSSVPLSIPTGTEARDGWADAGGSQGFERELRGILEELHAGRVRGVLVLTTDVHFATAFRYEPFPDDPAFELHEVVTGPMHAGIFPQSRFDTTFHPTRLFFFAPEPSQMPRTLPDALSWFNFGLLEISERGDLTARVIDATGTERASIRLPSPTQEKPERGS